MPSPDHPNERPAVSIITPSYNAAAFVGEAIASVQEDGLAYEHLVVDDGSSDDTAAVVERLAHPRVRLLRHPNGANRGVMHSRWMALQEARAEWVALLDADDRNLPARLTRQLEAVAGRPDVLLCHGDAVPFGGEDEKMRHTRDWFAKAGRDVSSGRSRAYLPSEDEGFLAFNFVCAPTVLLRRELALKVLAPTPQAFQVEDWVAWTLLTQEAGVFVYLKQDLVEYRMHAGSSTSRLLDNLARDHHAQLEFLLTIVAKADGPLREQAAARAKHVVGVLAAEYAGLRGAEVDLYVRERLRLQPGRFGRLLARLGLA